MEPIKSCVVRVLDESSWAEGCPPERSLVALFAVLETAALDRLLRDVTLRVSEELKPSEALRDILSGRQVFDAAGFEFPGGEELVDAFEYREASTLMARAPLKSISHAIEAVQASVSAVVAHRESARRRADPNEELTSPRQMWSRAHDVTEAWRFVLAVLRDNQD